MFRPAGHVTRRTLFRVTSLATASAVGAVAIGSRVTASAATEDQHRLWGQLDQKIMEGMARYAIPGAAVGVLYRGREYVKGYGVTSVDDPAPVDGDTVFRIASTTKTFTGTAAMRLAERGKLSLDASVYRYLPDFRSLDAQVARRVTVRQLLNHTAGWLGDDFADTGSGARALADFVAGMARLPQLTAPGSVFAYNNAALDVVGRIIEVVTGLPYEQALRNLVLDPLGLRHSGFVASDVAGCRVAVPHGLDDDGTPVATSAFFDYPRGQNPDGGLISSVRDQLRYARFHLGDGTVPGGRSRLLSGQSLRGMRSNPGPGGTMLVELDGMGITWMLRPSAQGVRIVQHGGSESGQHSGFLMVPDQGFAITLLTNSDGGANLVGDLFTDDWALRRFCGLSNLPAEPHALSRRELAAYEGVYSAQEVGRDGRLSVSGQYEISASDGQLLVSVGGEPYRRAAFYRPDYALVLKLDGQRDQPRVDFVRGDGGRVEWLRVGGRLARRQ